MRTVAGNGEASRAGHRAMVVHLTGPHARRRYLPRLFLRIADVGREKIYSCHPEPIRIRTGRRVGRGRPRLGYETRFMGQD